MKHHAHGAKNIPSAFRCKSLGADGGEAGSCCGDEFRGRDLYIVTFANSFILSGVNITRLK